MPDSIRQRFLFVNVLPPALLNSLAGISGFDREAFEAVHAASASLTSIRFNPAKNSKGVGRSDEIAGESDSAGKEHPAFVDDLSVSEHTLPLADRIPWTAAGYYLTHRPSFTFDPLFHAGVYYVQEASSMFLEQAMQQTTDLTQPLRVLDLCAAPGGKSTHLQSLISPDSLLVSNEVIKQRAAILEENLIKWGAPNVVVTNNDPQDFARLENFFDVLVIDAPCSGSGLFRREPEAIREWSEQAVQLCSQRQQRILADSYPALKEEGILIYSTCSYSTAEDEEILDWLMQEFNLESLPLNIPAEWGIVPVQSAKQQAWGYRFFPDRLRGEGFFMACFRKKDGGQYHQRPPKRSALQKASKNEATIVAPWLDPKTPLQYWKQGDMILAFPAILEQELLAIADKLYIRNAGITTGKIAGNALVPDHALAVSQLISREIVGVSLKREEALQYLRKEPVNLPNTYTGWALVQYENVPLGWVKILSNRVNNYYPSAWRILKSGNN